MRDGKLMWHKRLRGWFVSAHDDEYRTYRLYQCESGGWDVEVQVRFTGEREDLGWRKYLKDAKAVADSHHHARIRECDDDNLRAYIARYPL
jgi:hypothetical protein